MSLIFLLAVSAAPIRSPTSVKFDVGGVGLQMVVPPGFCLPKGELAKEAKARAAADDIAVTHATFYKCDSEGKLSSNEYVIVKTINRLLQANVTRADLLSLLGTSFKKPEFAELMNDRLESDAAKALQSQIKLSATLVPLGEDEVCGYMGGNATVQYPSHVDVMSSGLCISAIGGRSYSINIYSKEPNRAPVVELLKRARAIAMTIRPASRV